MSNLVLNSSLVAASVPGGRLGPTITALAGLVAAFDGWRAFRGHGRAVLHPMAIMGAGAAVILAGAVFLALADDGPGSGNGVVGSGAAIVLGAVAIALGAGARRRTHLVR